MNGTVATLATFDDGLGGGPALYAGGEFTTAGGTAASNIAKWDGTSWSALGTGLNGTVFALTTFDDGSGGGPALYAGGIFTTAGGTAANRVARWNGTAWSALGTGMNNSVLVLTTFDDGSGGGPALYAGGEFTTAGGTAANRIARWNGTTWSALGTGSNGFIHALTAFDDGSGGGPALYAGGGFTAAGGTAANRVARWNGTSWSTLGTGIDNSVYDLTTFDDNSGGGVALFASGTFTMAGGTAADRIAHWNGTTWSALGTGMNDLVYALTTFDDSSCSGPALYAGGTFATAGGTVASRIAQWNGTAWSGLGTGMNDGVFALTSFDDGSGAGPALYVGGDFTMAGETLANRIARWGPTAPPCGSCESCIEVHALPGCGDQACCKAVCAFDSSCCDTAWDSDCVSTAQQLCDGGVACPVSDHDCFTTGDPGCTDIACCKLVCAVDPFCCESAWDGICVVEAEKLCGYFPPPNDDCDQATTITNGITPFSTLGATTDGPALPPDCERAGELSFVNDIWFLYTATCDGTVTISTCNSANYDTRLALYTTNCNDLRLQCCNDDATGCGLTSKITCDVQCGESFLLRVGGYSGSGSGTIDVSCSGTPCNNCPGNDFSPGGCVLEFLEEPCGTDTNGGCNSVPAAFTDIQCGDEICGDFWALGGTRDTDFYRFTLAAPAVVRWDVYADVPVTLIILSANSCSAPFLATGVGDCPTAAIAELCPGTYWAFVAPLQFEDLPCAEYYNANLICTPFGIPPYIGQCCGNLQAGSCVSVHPTPFCDNMYCCEQVCTNDPHCCISGWDALCVQRAAAIGCASETLLCPDGGTERAYVCEAGCRDEFDTSNGAEPSNGPLFCLGFDELLAGGCFEHTFTDCWPSCPAGCGPNACGTITGAFLEIRFQTVWEDGAPPFDDLVLLDQGTPASDPIPLSGLQTLVLDLANLPGAVTNILATLCDGELGVSVSDHTGVDYVALTVIHCPCDNPFRPLFERDDPGNFTTPSPTTASQALQDVATCSSGPLTSYDVAAVNQCFVETIDLAPYTCILDGYLRICVVPSGSGSVNDSLALELIGPYECGPSAFAWGMSLADLEALGLLSPPLAEGQVSCIDLFLDDLPPSASGVRDISSHLLDGSLDILIQDDTGVTSVFFGPQVCECEDVFDCTGDLTGDEVVNGADLGILLGNWGGDGEGDFNGDDVVDGADLGVLLGAWGVCP